MKECIGLVINKNLALLWYILFRCARKIAKSDY